MDKASESTKKCSPPGLGCQVSSSDVLINSWATPGETTQAGATPREWPWGPGSGEKEPLPGSPEQNSELPFIAGGSFIARSGAGGGGGNC